MGNRLESGHAGVQISFLPVTSPAWAPVAQPLRLYVTQLEKIMICFVCGTVVGMGWVLVQDLGTVQKSSSVIHCHLFKLMELVWVTLNVFQIWGPRMNDQAACISRLPVYSEKTLRGRRFSSSCNSSVEWRFCQIWVLWAELRGL